jgi:hypothetical protein
VRRRRAHALGLAGDPAQGVTRVRHRVQVTSSEACCVARLRAVGVVSARLAGPSQRRPVDEARRRVPLDLQGARRNEQAIGVVLVRGRRATRDALARDAEEVVIAAVDGAYSWRAKPELAQLRRATSAASAWITPSPSRSVATFTAMR